jgi:hypothetical protein
MKPLHDFFYRFPRDSVQMSGRCRVRIFLRNRGAHTVLLTELNTNAGESISSACDRIATDLVAKKGLNPKTTRWIQHEPALDGQPDIFDEVHFTWGSDMTAGAPQWLRLNDEQVEMLTGQSRSILALRLGDPQPADDALVSS